MRRPVDARLGDGTAEHALRGVGPAQDYPCPVGTPVRAPFAAVRIVRWGDDDALGGYALTGYAANGDYWVLQHLSEYRNGRNADEGDTVALSGNSGRWTDGPHLHHYVVLNGVRHNPEDIGLYNNPAPAGTQEEDMLNDDDKNWVRDTVRQEIGGALSAFADTYKDQNWAREAVRQEIGGALSAFTGQIADAVAARVEVK